MRNPFRYFNSSPEVIRPTVMMIPEGLELMPGVRGGIPALPVSARV